MIVLVHKLTQRVLTSSTSACERMCGKSVYIWVRECVRYKSAFFSIHLSCLSENGQYLKFLNVLCVGSVDGSPVRLSISRALLIKALLLSQAHKSEWAFGSKVMLKSTRIRLCYTCRIWPVIDTHRFTSIAALSALPALKKKKKMKWLNFQYPLDGIWEKRKMSLCTERFLNGVISSVGPEAAVTAGRAHLSWACFGLFLKCGNSAG